MFLLISAFHGVPFVQPYLQCLFVSFVSLIEVAATTCPSFFDLAGMSKGQMGSS
jgi:hypothetical protein